MKPILKQRLIERKEAVSYMEPEKTIISRSGDECVVALCDQASQTNCFPILTKNYWLCRVYAVFKVAG